MKYEKINIRYTLYWDKWWTYQLYQRACSYIDLCNILKCDDWDLGLDNCAYFILVWCMYCNSLNVCVLKHCVNRSLLRPVKRTKNQCTTGSICWWARGVKGQVWGSIPTGNNPPSMNGRRRVMGWGALGCSNLTASGARGGVARDVTYCLAVEWKPVAVATVSARRLAIG